MNRGFTIDEVLFWEMAFSVNPSFQILEPAGDLGLRGWIVFTPGWRQRVNWCVSGTVLWRVLASRSFLWKNYCQFSVHSYKYPVPSSPWMSPLHLPLYLLGHMPYFWCESTLLFSSDERWRPQLHASVFMWTLSWRQEMKLWARHGQAVLIISVPCRWRQEESKFKASLGYILWSYIKIWSDTHSRKKAATG